MTRFNDLTNNETAAGSMTASITISMDSDAFAAFPAPELARMLRELAERIISEGVYSTKLLDFNGNVVGNFNIINTP